MLKLQRISLLIATAFLLLTASAGAQVVGTSAILQSTTSNQLDGYSETDIQDADTAYYYYAGVDGYAFEGNNQVDEQTDAPEYQTAVSYPSAPIHQGNTYTIYSDHYLIAVYEETDGYYNPQYYDPGNAFAPGDGGGDPTGTGYDPGGGDEYLQEQLIYLGYTRVQLSTAPPTISSLSPSSDIRGSSGTIQVQGQNLKDDLGAMPTARFQDGDITVSVSSADATTASLSYNVSASATIGTHQLVMTNTWGDSEPSNFTVGYPPAVVTGVSPSTWLAGNDYDVTVTGTGFGSAPSVSAIAAGVSAGSAYGSSPDGTQTHFHVHVDINSPNEGVQIVVSPGYAGSNFTCGNCNGGSPNGNAAVVVQAVTPAPTIMRVNSTSDLSSCTNGTALPNGQGETDVFAGEQILLCVQNPPSGASIASQSWSVQQASDITGGFVSTAGTGKPSRDAGGREGDRPVSSGQSFSFFFLNINAGETVTYVWTLANGGQASATADFRVQGPTGDLLPHAQMQPPSNGIVVSGTSGSQKLSTANQPLSVRSGYAGIEFTSTATPPAGANASFMWVQLIGDDRTRVISSVGDNFVNTSTPGLDGTYPYFAWSSSGTYDTPSSSLPSIYGELWRNFDATMYLMWDPALPGGCTPATTSTDGNYVQAHSTCTSTPVPLGSIRWRYQGCAVNTLNQSSGPWVKQCGADQVLMPASAGYPSWTSTVNPLGMFQ